MHKIIYLMFLLPLIISASKKGKGKGKYSTSTLTSSSTSSTDTSTDTLTSSSITDTITNYSNTTLSTWTVDKRLNIIKVLLSNLSRLHQIGVAHRDMSPENLMVHDGNVYIIDLGMCLRIPSLHDDHDDNGHDIVNDSIRYHPDERALIAPQTVCGKWYYLSPEVCLSEEPFDGPAVDLWAAGVILFIMLTGIPVRVVVFYCLLFTTQAHTHLF